MGNSILGSDCFVLGQSQLGSGEACTGGGPNVYNEQGHGGVVCGGACGLGGSSTISGSGGVVCGSSADVSKITTVGTSGGVTCGGAGSASCSYGPPCSGGVVCGGTTSPQVTYNPGAAGGVVCGGAADESLQEAGTINETMEGGVVCGGDTSPQLVFNPGSSGGVTCGGSGSASCVYSPAAAGGVVCGGAGADSKICNEAGSGGVVCGGSANIQAVYAPGSSGGVTVGGAGDVSGLDVNTYNEVMAGGVKCGGTAVNSMIIVEDPCCAPNVIIITPAGGIVIGGTAAHSSTREPTSGGIKCGGAATVTCPTRTFDGFEAIYHLCESGNGTAGEFRDSSGHGYHAQGGKGFETQCPDVTSGVFYRANEFDGRDFVNCPEFKLKDTQPHQISLWAKRQNQFLQRVFYSIGQTDGITPEGVQLQIGHTSRNKPFAKVQVISGDDWQTYQATGTTVMDADCWYLFHVQWEPGVGVSLYVNGELDGFVAVTETTLVPSTSGSYIGRRDNVEYAQAKIQEVRITPDLKDESWLAADYMVFCNDDLYTVSSEESPIYF